MVVVHITSDNRTMDELFLLIQLTNFDIEMDLVNNIVTLANIQYHEDILLYIIENLKNIKVNLQYQSCTQCHNESGDNIINDIFFKNGTLIKSSYKNSIRESNNVSEYTLTFQFEDVV